MPPIDTLPALLLPALVLLALAVFMPFTGRREARRRAAWNRFDALIRIRGVGGEDREALATWAQVAIPDKPHNVLVRRKDFDRFSRSEVHRLRSFSRPVFDAELERLAELRRLLGFDHSPGMAQSSHDLAPGELLDLRSDDGRRLSLSVARVDEEGVHVEAHGPRHLPVGPAWVTFARDGEGHYRFRSAPIRAGLLSHGEFLVSEERRRDPRISLNGGTFWVAVERLPDGGAPEDPEGVEVEALDVSVGGIAMMADREVRKGSELWMDLHLGSGREVPVIRGLSARVLGHGFREGGGLRPHFLHCAFLPMEEEKLRVLEAFVWGRLAPKARTHRD